MAAKRILVLGGGVGGLVTANELGRRLGPEHSITLVERNPYHLFNPSLLWVLAGWRRPEQLTKPLRQMVRPEVKVVQTEVQGIDPQAQRVITASGPLDYDYLVLALGAELAPERMPGFAEGAHDFFTLEGVTRLRQALVNFPGGRVAVVVSSLPYKCPAAPYEAALLIDDVLRRRGLRERCQVDVYTPEPLPMPVAGPALGQAVVDMMGQKGIIFHPQVQVESIDPQGKALKFKGGATAGYDFLIGVPPHRPPAALAGSGLTNEAGWVPVNPRTLATRAENVFAVGDVTAIILPNGKPLPRAGVFAHAEAEAVAHNIADTLAGASPKTEFDGVGYCWVETGGGKAGFASGNFYAQPDPAVEMQAPGRVWHWGKELFEGYWMGGGLTRRFTKWAMVVGSKLYQIPASF